MKHRWRLAVSAVLLVVPGTAPVAQADPVASPPFIDHVQWAAYGNNRSTLRVYPTASGRAAAGDLGGAQREIAEAWTEVLKLAPDANSPGMRAQFACHWQFAEFAEPGKSSWNLEPWRPVVDENTMIQSGCNPGGSEEPS
jgi:hypothetical protein